MNLIHIIGIASDATFVIALIISIKKFDKPLSKYYLTFPRVKILGVNFHGRLNQAA